MATAAVFLALGGGAYAAVKLPKNSVGRAQLRRGAVTPTKVAKATIRRFKGHTGAQGVPGLRGDPGSKGDRGPVGPTAGFASTPSGIPSSPATTVYSTTVNMPVAGKLYIDATDNVSITCGAGDCGEYFEIRVDGAALPSNGIGFVDEAMNSSKFEGVNVIGVSGALSSGNHTIALKRDNNYGSPSMVDFSDEQSIAAVLLGG